MKLITCLKEVPGREGRYQVASGGRWIDESNLSFEINECDEYALEESLKLKETHGGEVILLTVGKERAEKAMRKGLAKGADRGILVVDEEGALGSPFAVASALSEAIRREGCDLVLAGTQSDDYSYAQTGVVVAGLLDWPHATIVMEIQGDPAAGRVKALREMESGWFEWVEMPLPAVLTVQAGISPLRYASLKGIMQAGKKEIRRVSVAELGVDPAGLPALEITELYFPETTSRAELLEGSPEEVATLLLEKLRKEAKVLG